MKITDIIIDDEFEDFLPALQPDERQALKEEIERDGFTDPLIVWLNHGELIDGYNRYRIWLELGADPDNSPDIIERKFADRAAVMEWMFHHQIARRNMTAAQRAATALKMKPAFEERASANAKASGGDKKSHKQGEKSGLTNSSNPIQPVNTRKEIAKVAGVSEDTVRKTEAVIEHGKKSTKKKMLAGEMSANEAFKETKPPKNGSVIPPVYDDKKIDKPLGAIRRELDERLKAFPQTERLFRAAKHALGEFVNRINEWRGAK